MTWSRWYFDVLQAGRRGKVKAFHTKMALKYNRLFDDLMTSMAPESYKETILYAY